MVEPERVLLKIVEVSIGVIVYVFGPAAVHTGVAGVYKIISQDLIDNLKGPDVPVIQLSVKVKSIISGNPVLYTAVGVPNSSFVVGLKVTPGVMIADAVIVMSWPSGSEQYDDKS